MHRMLGRKTLLILGLILYLSCATTAKGGGGGRGGSRGGSRSRTRYGGGGGGGGGSGLDSTTVIFLIVAGVAVVLILICWCACSLANEEENREKQNNVPLVTGSQPASRNVVMGNQPAKRKTPEVVHSNVVPRKVEIPYSISETEEMALYEQDQIWLKEAQTEGRLNWRIRKHTEYQFDMQMKRKKERFLAMYWHPFGGQNNCHSCGVSLAEENKWYRCRVCADVDLCAKCFATGPSITSCGHVSSHEFTKLQIHEKCSKCKCFIHDTKFRCETCVDSYDVYFCLGCYMTGMHGERHSDHVFKRINATSYIMQSANHAQNETSALIRRNEKFTEPSAPNTYPPSGPYSTSATPYPPSAVPYAPSGMYPPPEVPSAAHMKSAYPPAEAPSMPFPAVPPPSYDKCT